MQSALKSLERLWNNALVELKGSYSVERMHSLKKYAEETRMARVVGVIVLTPIPCLVAILSIDYIKLSSPAEGLQHSQRLWLRTVLVTFFISWTQLKRCHRFVSGLPKTPVFDLVAPWMVAFGLTGFLWSLSLIVGFPLPFTGLIGAIGWWILAAPLFFIRFGGFVRASPELSRQAKLFTWSIVCEMNTASLYSLYTVVFVGLGVRDQIAFSLLLPIMKIASKNVTRKLFQHKEDLIPEVVVFTTEIFHSLFLVLFMQESRSIGTTFALMVVDVACSILAIHDVQKILELNVERCRKNYAAKNETPAVVPSFLPLAAYLISKPHMAIKDSGIRLQTEATRVFVVRPGQLAPSGSILQSNAIQVANKTTRRRLKAALSAEERAFADSLSSQDQRLIVRDILKLLHLTEFLLLIEYVEIVVPVVYCAYALCLLKHGLL